MLADAQLDRPSGGALLRMGGRYGLSTVGPVAVSGAHFVASLFFLRLLAPAAFGQFSFLLIVVPFCLGAAGALLGAPASLTRGKEEAVARREIGVLRKASLIVSLAAGVIVAAMMASTGADRATAAVFGVYGAAAVLRGFCRSLANVHARLARVAASDAVYGAGVLAGLGSLAAAGTFSLHGTAVVFVLATIASFLPFGRGDIAAFGAAARTASLGEYRPLWRNVTRWSLSGVALTEVAANAHAYLVTFFSGPGAFGLLALGSLFMRPASLVLSALPDIDQPVMARRLARRDVPGAFQVVNEFRTAAGAVLAANIVLAAALVIWFPHLLLRKNYDATEVLVVLALWVAITALRVVRTPDAVFLQATGDYASLARIGAWSGAVSVALTAALLLTAGPIASLGGILAGEVVIVLMLFPLTRAWRRQHG